MSSPNRTRRQRRTATSVDLTRVLKRNAEIALLVGAILFLAAAGLEAAVPPQMPPFLEGLPAVGETYDPQQDITRRLKDLIADNDYEEAFLQAIDEVYRDAIPELNRIQTLDQFYFYLDALVTWIPGIRVWELAGEVLHERTVYLRLTEFYYYFNKPSLVALQSPTSSPSSNAKPTCT